MGDALASVLMLRAEVLQRMKRYDEAVEDCTRVISTNTDHIRGYLRRAAVFEAKGDTASAARDWEQAKRVDPENPGAPKVLLESLIDIAQLQL